jgi:hypothetical protein
MLAWVFLRNASNNRRASPSMTSESYGDEDYCASKGRRDYHLHELGIEQSERSSTEYTTLGLEAESLVVS